MKCPMKELEKFGEKLIQRERSRKKVMSKTKLTGIELSNYLASKNVGKVDQINELDTPTHLLGNPNTRLDEILPIVQNLLHNVEFLNAKTIHTSIGQGVYLQTAYDLWKIHRIRKKITQPWKQWLISNIGISEQYARQLRQIGKKFSSYRRLYYVAISFKEFYSKRNEIWSMLLGRKELRDFWREPKTPPQQKSPPTNMDLDLVPPAPDGALGDGISPSVSIVDSSPYTMPC